MAGGQCVVDVKDHAPVFECAVGSQLDRSRLITGSDDLEQQVRTAFVDGWIAQFIKEEQRGEFYTMTLW